MIYKRFLYLFLLTISLSGFSQTRLVIINGNGNRKGQIEHNDKVKYKLANSDTVFKGYINLENILGDSSEVWIGGKKTVLDSIISLKNRKNLLVKGGVRVVAGYVFFIAAAYTFVAPITYQNRETFYLESIGGHLLGVLISHPAAAAFELTESNKFKKKRGESLKLIPLKGKG